VNVLIPKENNFEKEDIHMDAFAFGMG